jgi:hypothetical protein
MAAEEDDGRPRVRIVLCTVCHHALWSPAQVHTHPALGSALCAACHNPFQSWMADGELQLSLEEDEGHHDRCTWCLHNGESLTLLLCSACPRTICEECIHANLGDAALQDALADDSWLCYVCNPAPLASMHASLAIAILTQRELLLRGDCLAPCQHGHQSLAPDAPAACASALPASPSAAAAAYTNARQRYEELLHTHAELSQLQPPTDPVAAPQPAQTAEASAAASVQPPPSPLPPPGALPASASSTGTTQRLAALESELQALADAMRLEERADYYMEVLDQCERLGALLEVDALHAARGSVLRELESAHPAWPPDVLQASVAEELALRTQELQDRLGAMEDERALLEEGLPPSVVQQAWQEIAGSPAAPSRTSPWLVSLPMATATAAAEMPAHAVAAQRQLDQERPVKVKHGRVLMEGAVVYTAPDATVYQYDHLMDAVTSGHPMGHVVHDLDAAEDDNAEVQEQVTRLRDEEDRWLQSQPPRLVQLRTYRQQDDQMFALHHRTRKQPTARASMQGTAGIAEPSGQSSPLGEDGSTLKPGSLQRLAPLDSDDYFSDDDDDDEEEDEEEEEQGEEQDEEQAQAPLGDGVGSDISGSGSGSGALRLDGGHPLAQDDGLSTASPSASKAAGVVLLFPTFANPARALRLSEDVREKDDDVAGLSDSSLRSSGSEDEEDLVGGANPSKRAKSHWNAAIQQKVREEEKRRRQYDEALLQNRQADADVPEQEFVVNTVRKPNTDRVLAHHELAVALRPHQREGISFMWGNIVGLDHLADDRRSGARGVAPSGLGCILAHGMGLGKTLQVSGEIFTLAGLGVYFCWRRRRQGRGVCAC